MVFTKGDGGTFRSTRVTAQDWDFDDYSTKLIGAKYFSAGAKAAGFDFQYDFLSPRDGDGHGSHTASTAAGNNGVAATVEGIDFGAISGVAPAAKVAMYKACYDGPDPLVTDDDICALSDLLAAIDAATDDGVDVINYSIGGGAATTVLSSDDLAFLYAAAAGHLRVGERRQLGPRCIDRRPRFAVVHDGCGIHHPDVRGNRAGRRLRGRRRIRVGALRPDGHRTGRVCG